LQKALLWLGSATREDLAEYAREGAISADLEEGAVRQLEAAIDGEVQDQVRSFSPAAQGKPDARCRRRPRRKGLGMPAKPFAHPVYWGGFVLTGR